MKWGTQVCLKRVYIPLDGWSRLDALKERRRQLTSGSDIITAAHRQAFDSSYSVPPSRARARPNHTW